MKKKLVKFMLNEFKNDSRNMREIDVAQTIYDEVVVICPKKSKNYKNVTKYNVITYDHFLSKNKIIRTMQILNLILFKIPTILKHQKAHTISCQDLFAMMIGWYSTLFISHKPYLIYDSHELEVERNTNGKRGKISSKIIPIIEKKLMKKAEFSIFACDSAAKYVQKLYNLKNTPLVIRNTPYKSVVDKDLSHEYRKKFLFDNGLETNTFICIYHGIIGQGRGLEKSIKAISLVDNAVMVILGMGEDSYVLSLQKFISNVSPNKIYILPAVQPNSVVNFISMADVGLITIKAVTKSYYYMLPNKFFENIQAENPMICSDFPEVGGIIKKYDIGVLVDPENEYEIRNAIIKLKNDKELYNSFKNNILVAKEDLCWEKERDKLYREYAKIVKRRQ